MLQYLLTFVVLAQPAQPAEVPPTPPAEATAPAPAGEAAAGDQPSGEGATPAAEGGEATGEGGEAAAATGEAAAATGEGGEAAAATGDPCDPNAPRPGGGKAKEMPPPGERTDIAAGTFWMPPSSSTATDSVDWLFYGILGLSIFCFAGITFAVVYFAWRYRHRKGHVAEPSSSHNDTLEITWTVIPSIICVVIFLLGWKGFMDLNTPPKHAYEVQVVAKKWDWSFKYPNGWVDTNLHVPVGEPVRLVMRSTDVLHSFWVPAFRIKNDVIPNRYTKLWFEAKTPGVYRLYCAEYCGTQHSNMKQLVVVHPPGGFEKYMEEAEQALLDMPPVKLGEYLFTARGCNQCHTVDGSAKTGPTWKGIFGTTQQTSAGAVTVDENYIRESILDPNVKVRAGFNAIMPTFRGQLKDEQIDGIITYIKCLK